jgi:hypothetical protein
MTCKFIEMFSGRHQSQDVEVLFLPKHQQHPEDGDGISSRNVGKTSHPDAVICPRKYD